MSNRVVHFEIGAEDPERAIDFYKNSFDWEIKKWEGSDSDMEYWLITTGAKGTPGIDGGIYKRTGNAKPATDNRDATNYICTINIENIDEMINKIKQNGGEIIDDKMEIPKVGTMAYARDTEGNIFGVMQTDPSAMTGM